MSSRGDEPLVASPQVDEALARLAAIVECSPDAIISKTLDGIVTSWNGGAQRLFGYCAEEMIGEPILHIIPPELWPEEDDILGRLRRGERVDHYETVRMTKDGRRVNVSLSISAFQDRSGRRIGAAKIARDITERKRTEEALRAAKAELQAHSEHLERLVARRTDQLSQSLSELQVFAYSLSHDIRSPLRGIRGFTSAVMEDAGERLDPESRENLGRVLAACHRLDRMIQDVLDFSRLAWQEFPIEVVNVDKTLRSLIAERPELQPPRAIITVEESLPLIRGNECSLVQCLANLLLNAVKFVGPGVTPQVRVWWEPAGSHVRLWVEDNGIGISAKDQHRIFGVFERIKGDYEGTGLGLAIVRKAAERMGGRVGVESEPGAGSRFWVELPAAENLEVISARLSQPAGV